jgi:rhamnogalacturonan endolyase
MSKQRQRFVMDVSLVAAVFVATVAGSLRAERQREDLGRGLIALRVSEDRVFLSWRSLASDSPEIVFHVYRSSGGGPVRLNAEPIAGATCFEDPEFDASKTNVYFVEPVLGDRGQPRSAPFELGADSPVRPYLSVPLKTPAGCTPNDASVVSWPASRIWTGSGRA